MRYSIEFVASLSDKSQIKKYLKAIKPAQESLGLYNDLIVAEDVLKKLVKAEPQVWFALGWIAAEQQRLLLKSQQDLLQFAKTAVLE